MNFARSKFLAVLLACACSTSAYAHFPWLVPQPEQGEPTSLQIYFAEDASPDDPKLLERLKGLQVWRMEAGKQPVELPTTATAEELSVSIPKGSAADAVYFCKHDLGVMTRGGETFRLMYGAKTGPTAGKSAWQKVETAKELKLDVVPSLVNGKLQVRVLFEGKPVAKAEVKTLGPGANAFDGATDENGTVTIETDAAGICSLRAKHVDATGGEVDGKKFDSTRYYTTVALPMTKPQVVPPAVVVESKIEPLLPAVTSFGAAISGGQLYTYGGNMGTAHSYSNKEQGRNLMIANVKGGAWTTGPEGPALQGLAMVAHGGKIYRIGGFTALNAAGEENKLESQASVAVYDPATKNWIELPSLPEPRSSGDAAVIGDTIYVAGGWNLSGGRGSEKWHKTAWKLDLSKSNLQWEALPEPPFQRRALSLAAHGGKLYVIGGMLMDGGPTARTDIFDPASGKWSEGPALIGEEKLTGFGNSSFATGGKLYVSTINGDLQRLSEDGQQWEVVAKMPTARFFHRMLPLDDKHLLVVGGGSMTEGKFEDVEIIAVP